MGVVAEVGMGEPVEAVRAPILDLFEDVDPAHLFEGGGVGVEVLHVGVGHAFVVGHRGED